MRRSRLLISARDPGAAHHLAEIARRADAHRAVELHLVAAEQAVGIFEAAGLAVERFYPGSIPGPQAPGAAEALEAARAIIARVAPDALLVGLSGPGCGVDEALVHTAAGTPSYVFQDYWGGLNEGWGTLPGTFLVIDDWAAELTRGLTSARVEVVGAPRYARAFSTDPAFVREEARRVLDVGEEDVVVTYFGQPLWDLEGYAATLRALAAGILQALPGARVRYRPHPKETTGEVEAALGHLQQGELRADADPWTDVGASLCATDIACTCFSSCGLDLAYMNRASSQPLGSVLYLLFEPDLARYYRQFSRIDDIPLAAQGLATTVTDGAHLVRDLREAGSPALRRARWESARRKVRAPQDAAEAALEVVLGDATGR